MFMPGLDGPQFAEAIVIFSWMETLVQILPSSCFQLLISQCWTGNQPYSESKMALCIDAHDTFHLYVFKFKCIYS